MRLGFNTQPPEGGWNYGVKMVTDFCRFNTQPPEGGWVRLSFSFSVIIRFNTQPPEGGWQSALPSALPLPMFQHTAARRRLVDKAAFCITTSSFNTQPPEGGWAKLADIYTQTGVSTHSRPKAAG